MTDEPTVQAGLPEKDRVLELLNEAYEGWGTKALFEWKYNDYPGFDPEQHCYYIEIDGDLAAFRRIFTKGIQTRYGNYPVFILGDTAVRKSHRGQGLYSELHEVTTDYCRSKGGIISTFNRVGNVTYKANIKRGWEFQTLPLQMKILDFSNVIGQYAKKVIQTGTRMHSLLSAIDGRISLRTRNGDKLALTEQTLTDRNADWCLSIPVPEFALETAVEIASQESKLEAARKGISRPKKSVTDRQFLTGASCFTVNSFESLTEEQVEDVIELYDNSRTQFARQTEEVKHILHYPDSISLLVRKESQLVAFSVLVPLEQRFTTEGRVLEFTALSRAAGYRMIQELEQLGQENQYDVLLVSTPQNITNWIDIGRQVFMWKPQSVMKEGLETDLRDMNVGLYDVA